MFEFIFGRQGQRLAILCLLFYILDSLDIHWDNTIWWCFTALLLLLEYLAHSQGMQDATTNLLTMRKHKLMKLKDFLDESVRTGKADPESLMKILKEQEEKNNE